MHYPLPTIEDVATCLHGAKVFTVMVVRKGFWHVELEEDSSATRAVKLNSDKIKLRQPKVPFIGHIATSKGLRADPNKVKVILEMPKPTVVAGVQRLLGMTKYLAKFLPHLSDLTKPLRELTQRS